ncbi:delta-lactam-biosynthetic de-N-acetylase [uncultured Flavonifractor sp.]|nr:delta-lactam-biosynthetic de-N-acetylase [uncultured Flavonifractor sp.]
MNWKKCLLSLLCAAAIVLGISLSGAQAAEGKITILALNDQVITPISSTNMPLKVGGTYYLPYTVFDPAVVDVDLGVKYSLRDNVLTLYTKQALLKYDLNAGTCEDRDGNTGYTRAVVRGSMIYVSMPSVCSFFGIQSYQEATPYGQVIRLTTSSAVLSDRDFMDSALSTSIADAYKKYWQAQESLNPSPSPSQSVSPSPSVSTPSPSPSPTNTDSDDKRYVTVSLAFRHTDGTGLADILDILARENRSALFFMPTDAIGDNAALIRRMVGEGHSVGLSVGGGPASDAAQMLSEGNRLLELAAHMNTRTVLVENEDEDTIAALEADGWSVWSGNVSLPESASVSYSASYILRSVDSKRSLAYITLDDDTRSAQILDIILPTLKEDGYSFRLAVGEALGW